MHDTWSLTPRAQRAVDNDAPLPYDGGGPWDPDACATHLAPHAAALRQILRTGFPWARDIGGLRCSPLHTSRGDQMSIHAIGRALDVMVPHVGGVEGETLANWLVSNASALGLQLVIWKRRVWQGSLRDPSRRWAPYTGTSPHTDHVHVEVSETPAPLVALVVDGGPATTALASLTPVSEALDAAPGAPADAPPPEPLPPLSTDDTTEQPDEEARGGNRGGRGGGGGILLLLLLAWGWSRRGR
jgi:hypothetical protein